jgi:RNA polymerase primary sigma factor
MVAMLNHILSAKEREILMRSFGIDCMEEGLEEIGFALGLTRERVRQIREKALCKIRRSNKIGRLAQYI